MQVSVHYSCENSRESGKTTIIVDDLSATSIRDVKYAIQDAIQAPVCDQKLFYHDQLLTDDDMLLSRLYFREGECFRLEFLAVANITGINEFLNILKSAAQEIVQNFQRELPRIEQHPFTGLWRFYDRLVNGVEGLAQFFFPWKSLRSVAQRHYFVQEGGFDAFLEVFKFSRQLYTVDLTEDDNDNSNSSFDDENGIIKQLKLQHNQGQLALQLCCLSFLWNFAETPEDRKFVLSKGVLPLTIDALLLHPQLPEDTVYGIDIYGLKIGVNETAIGCCGGLVESDSTTQEEVSKMTLFIEKLLTMIDGGHSEHSDYTLFSSQVASNTLFYCTFNVKSAPSLASCGSLTQMIGITRHLLVTEGGNTALRYYGCLFLARMRSAPLIQLDKDICTTIDKLIDMFLEKHLPREISEWEEEMSFVWMTMVPLVHLAFSAGNVKKSCSDMDSEVNSDNDVYQVCELERETQQSQEACLDNVGDNQQPEVAMSQMEFDLSLECFINQTWEFNETQRDLPTQNVLPVDSNTRQDETESLYLEIVESKLPFLVASSEESFLWPGSKSTQKLGIFSLVHMLSIKENQQLATSENLIPYLICLSWQLDDDDKQKLLESLANFHVVSPPSLKVAAKSVLARVKGLDLVFNS